MDLTTTVAGRCGPVVWMHADLLDERREEPATQE
jgi:hypothetical protein